MSLGNQPAFPHEFTPGDKQWSGPGMTYRQWLIGMIATWCHTSDRVVDGANWVVSQADAILECIENEDALAKIRS